MNPAKRWMTVATPDGGGWRVKLEKVGDLGALFARLRTQAGLAPVCLGVDAPIGLPIAHRSGQPNFPLFLRTLAADDPFFLVCDEPGEIRRERPFYPRRPTGGVRRQVLIDGFGLSDAGQLLRQCERQLGTQPSASPMFWTLGANQVGKGAICLWRDLLIPALHRSNPPLLWPFDGSLADLIQPGHIVVAETYPANAQRQMQLGFQGSKRRQSDRRRVAAALWTRLRAVDAEPDPPLSIMIDDGFGASLDGEDRFDSLIGLIRMLQVIRNPALDQRPEPDITCWEGWILGRPISIS